MRHLDDVTARLVDAIATGAPHRSILSARVDLPETAMVVCGEEVPTPSPSKTATVSQLASDSFDLGSGRPLVVDGRTVLAYPVMRTDWLAAEPTGPALLAAPSNIRDAIAEAWLADALSEHASIASFSRFALELLAVGAPAELVQDAHRAALDEVEHARLCFSLAERFGGEACGPGPLGIATLTITTDLRELVASAIREGCVRETIASISAREQLAVATQPSVRGVLTRLAEDEARHSELAWRFVSWAMSVGGVEVVSAGREAFELELKTPANIGGDEIEGDDVAWWHRAGRLTQSEMFELTRVVDERVIAIAARVLLERSETTTKTAA